MKIFLLVCHLLFHSVSSVCSSLNFLKIVDLKSLSVLCLVAQSCLTLCGPMDSSPPGSSVHGDSPGKNPAVGCHALLQGIFPTQGQNPGLPHCRQILYHLNLQGSPRILRWVANPFPKGTSRLRNQTSVICIAGGLLGKPNTVLPV